MLPVKIFVIAVVAIGLTGCQLFTKKPTEVITTSVDRVPLSLAMPDPLVLGKTEWIVITPENATEVWARLQKERADLVLFALTDRGYEQLALDFAQIRLLVEQQRSIILQYKKYYEAPKPE